jgi:hypothetical protein
MSITFSTCWYILKSKYDIDVYYNWIDNMLSNVNNYNLVIYSDINSCKILDKYLINPKIKLIILPCEEFYGYKYKDYWIKNHEKNNLLNNITEWKLNMIWCEKIHFVNNTIINKYFDTDMYGWCDIGYFRNRHNDLNKEILTYWPNSDKINNLDKNKIHYALINNDCFVVEELKKNILDKNEIDLPKKEITPYQTSIAGGFFICYKDKISWWKNTFDNKLKLYFENNYLVKDDQMIIADCVFSNIDHFSLYTECKLEFDNWFMFQRILL